MLAKRYVAALLLVLISLPLTVFAAGRNWQTGTLMSAERHDDPGAVEQHRENRGYSDNDGNYGSTTDTTTGRSDLHYNYMYYSVSAGRKLYLVRIMINLPWVKTPKADVGDSVEYAVDGTKFYFHNPDGSEAKAEIVRTTAQAAQGAPSKQ